MAGTKRRKIGPRAINRAVPNWVQRLVEHGEEPLLGSEGEIDLVGWLFWGEPVPGLPPIDTPEGWAIWDRRKRRQLFCPSGR
jgi:hypothetical protein